LQASEAFTGHETIMKKQKPLRTLKAPLFPPDHFTMEQAREAVLAVMAERGETPVFDVIEEVTVNGSPRPPAQRRDAA
jgi:hypothetical protein